MRGGTTRYLILGAFGAAALPLTCVLPLAVGPGPGRQALLTIYAIGCVTAVGAVARSMRREGRRLMGYDTEIHGICPACGYDMRATPDRCPECGRAAGAGFD